MKRGMGARPLLKSDILLAQANTHSAAQAARYLNVSYNTYKKWARYFGVHETFKNPTGKGVHKGAPSWKTTYADTEKILRGEKIPPKTNRFRTVARILKFKFLDERCVICGESEKRITDGKATLLINFKDGNKDNWKHENLEMLCLNHFFLTVGDIVNRGRKFIY